MQYILFSPLNRPIERRERKVNEMEMEMEIADMQEWEVCSPLGLSLLRLLPCVGSHWNYVYEDRALCKVVWRL
jgi:hypothetical protein